MHAINEYADVAEALLGTSEDNSFSHFSIFLVLVIVISFLFSA